MSIKSLPATKSARDWNTNTYIPNSSISPRQSTGAVPQNKVKEDQILKDKIQSFLDQGGSISLVE